MPKRVKARAMKHASCNTQHIRKNITLTKEQLDAVNKISKNSKFNPPAGGQNSKFLLYGPASSGKTEVYIHAIKKLKEKNANLQFLILLPELTLTPQAIERYGAYFSPEETVILHSKISKGKFYSDWQDIKSGKAKIIIGSRMAVFAPFKNLGLIVIDEEQDMSFKQWDMNPRYDARTVSEKLAEIHSCKIVFGSATPRIESFHKARQEKYTLLELPQLVGIGSLHGDPIPTKIELVDMKKERWIKNYSPISKKLQSEIAYALKNKLQTILFINRQGLSSFSICTRCKTVLRCPKCERALIYDKEGVYKCVHCAYRSSVIPECPKCKSLTFTNVGLGTQKIEREVASLFPGARIARADNQTMKEPRAQENLYKIFKDGEIDILIGTQIISKGWDLPNVALIGIIDGDGMLSIPDYTTEERAFQNIIQVAGRTGRTGAKFPGLVLVQMFHPESSFFKNISEKNLENFYDKELKDRKALRLPPFGKLIKLIFQDYSAKKAASAAEGIYKILESMDLQGIKISEAQDSFVSNIRGRHRRQLIIKISDDIPEKLAKILKALPSGWIIDVDPISII
ncbi:MAG TPA: primosomal protein N' [Candidatus Moranbacteria bacterium]|nr:primosomal protein N' [Candidatus Moranbacteria bacterium]